MSLRDLSEQDRHALTRARLAAIVRSSADAIIGETLDGIITDWNPAAERLYGYTAEETIGQHLSLLVPPEERAGLAERIARVRRGESIEGIEAVRWTKDGRRLDVSLSVSPVYNDAGEIVATSAIVRDISAVKAHERALAASEERFRVAFDDAPIGIALTAPDTRVLHVNRAICAILGYSAAELLATTFQQLTHPEDVAATRALVARALAGEITTYAQEKRYIRKDGQIVWALLNGSLVRDETGAPRYFISQIQDITERKRTDQQLQTALEAAQAANQATRQFLTMMSHELRTPMQAIMGYAELLLAGPEGSLTPDQAADVLTIQRGANRLVDLVKQMLDLSRLDAGQTELNTESVDLATTIETVRQDVAPQAAAKALALRIDLPAELPPVLGDEMGLYQILLNLVGNAVKFTERGEVGISATATDDEVAVTVRDSGIGIAPAVLPHIFEEFHQGDHGMTRRYEGAGLGLTIARRLAERMGGRLSVASQPGVGSNFTLHLPVDGPRPDRGHARGYRRG